MDVGMQTEILVWKLHTKGQERGEAIVSSGIWGIIIWYDICDVIYEYDMIYDRIYDFFIYDLLLAPLLLYNSNTTSILLNVYGYYS